MTVPAAVSMPTSTSLRALDSADQPTASTGGRSMPALARQAALYVAVGATATALNTALYLPLRSWIDAVPAAMLALAVSAVASTEAHHKRTFAGSEMIRYRQHAQNALVFLFYCGYSTVTLAAVQLIAPDPTPQVEAFALAMASTAGGLTRFLLLQSWVFRRTPSR
jgi:putative flippase GtrA